MKKVKAVKVIKGRDVIIEEGAIIGYPKTNDPIILEDGAHIHSGAIIYSGCRIGKNSHIYHHSVLLENTIIGDYTKIGALCMSQGNNKIGNFVTMASHCHLTSYIQVEDGVFIAQGVQTANSKNMGGRLHPNKRRLIEAPKIERGARIGAGAAINPGVIIGQEALIGSGAIVTKNIPPFSIAIGVPARVVGEVPIADRIDWDLTFSKFQNKGEYYVK